MTKTNKRRNWNLKDLSEMGWQELCKLREQLNNDLGEAQDNDLVKDPESDPHEWVEGDLIDALATIHGLSEAKQPGEKQGAPKSPPKGYPSDKGKYADPTNYKYPLDTEAHVRAALSYFSKAKNRSGYSPEEQKFMWKRIIAATKKYGIELSDDVKKQAEALGDSNSDGEGVKEELNEKEVVELIHKALHEQMQQNPGGMLAQGGKGSGGMEAYQPQVRVPPDIEAINTQLEGFKQMHAKHEKANTDMAAKVDALTKQVSDLTETFKVLKDSMPSISRIPDPEKDTDMSKTAEKKKAASEAKEASGAKAASGKKASKDDDDDDGHNGDDDEDDDDDDGDSQQEKKNKEAKDQTPSKKKAKEQVQQAHAEGLVATSEMASGTGVNPPGFAADTPDDGPRKFGDVMSRAARIRRRGNSAS